MKIFSFLFLVFSISITASSFSEDVKKPFVVVLDAGHGGHDSGNRGNGYFEKDIALDIILKTGAILSKDPNIKVIYTRKTDVFIPLNKRGDIANKAKADLFVSVHCNAHHTNASGTETFVLGLHANQRNFDIAKKENSVILMEDDYKKSYDGFDPNSPESIIGITLMQEAYLEQSLGLASFVQQNFSKQLKRSNRGVKQAGFLVLHRTFMPSVLIETGFLTNRNEGKYLNSGKGKDDMAKAISKAINDYKKSVELSFEIDQELDMVFDEKEKPKSIKKPLTKKEVIKTASEKGTKQPKDTSAKSSDITDKNDGKAVAKLNKIASKVTSNKSLAPIFKIQLAAGSTKIDPLPENFKGLSGVEVKEVGGKYKYFYGDTERFSEIKNIKSRVIGFGYTKCFIVAFEGDNMIPLSEALLKQQKNM